jgi:hypothetical protein
MNLDLKTNKELMEALEKVKRSFDNLYHPEKFDKEYIKI